MDEMLFIMFILCRSDRDYASLDLTRHRCNFRHPVCRCAVVIKRIFRRKSIVWITTHHKSKLLEHTQDIASNQF